MRITAYIGAAVLGLAMMAFAPIAAMADPAPDLCVLDLSQPVSVDLALNAAEPTCAAFADVDVDYGVPIVQGPDDGAAAFSMITANAELFDFAGHRQHEDPGRMLA